MSRSLLVNPTALEAGLEAVMIARAGASDTQRAAFERYARLGMPNRRTEGWKWSDFRAAVRNVNSVKLESIVETPLVYEPSAFAALNPIELRIVNGRILLPECRSVDGLECAVIDPTATHPDYDHHAIAALNVAFSRKALGFKILKDAVIERPILIRHITNINTPIFSQILARIEDGARATIVETFEGGGVLYSTLFHLGVRDGAVAERYVLQDSDRDTITHGFFGAAIGAGARFKQTTLSTGGRLSRHETHLLCPVAGASSDIASAALLSDERHSDFTSIIYHQGEGCVTRQSHKGVAAHRGRNVFQGKFHVARAAQKTDARMTANALLLSDTAEADHKPELEIYADDVECAHGSTCGALDKDALFYLRQRGLDEPAARALLIEAFVGEAIDSVDDAGVREIFAARVKDWLAAL